MPHFGTLLLIKAVLLMFAVVLQSKMAVEGARQGTSVLTLRTSGKRLTNRTKTDAPKRRKVWYTVRLQLPDLTMNHYLNDKSSAEHQQLTQQLTKDVQQLFTNISGEQRVRNIRFSDRLKEPASLTDPGSWQRETSVLSPSIGPKPLPLLLSTLSPTQSLSSTTSRRKGGLGRSTRKYSGKRVKLLSTVPSIKKSLQKIKKTDISTVATTIIATTTMATTSVVTTTSSHTTTSTKSTTEPSEKVFDVVLITRLFKECYTRDYLILMDPYLEAYVKLLTIFKVLGPVFAFAGDDARSKLTTLRQLREQDVASSQNNYLTIQSMFEFEHSPQGAKADLEGVSTNAWVHKILKFINGVVIAALDVNSEKTLGNRAQELYTEIMAPHHEWYIRAAAYLAFLSFPSRESLMAQLDLTDSAEDHQKLRDLSSAIDAVYADVESLYVKYAS